MVNRRPRRFRRRRGRRRYNPQRIRRWVWRGARDPRSLAIPPTLDFYDAQAGHTAKFCQAPGYL